MDLYSLISAPPSKRVGRGKRMMLTVPQDVIPRFVAQAAKWGCRPATAVLNLALGALRAIEDQEMRLSHNHPLRADGYDLGSNVPFEVALAASYNPRCEAFCGWEIGPYPCTRERGHGGAHVARAAGGVIVAAWDEEGGQGA